MTGWTIMVCCQLSLNRCQKILKSNKDTHNLYRPPQNMEGSIFNFKDYSKNSLNTGIPSRGRRPLKDLKLRINKNFYSTRTHLGEDLQDGPLGSDGPLRGRPHCTGAASRRPSLPFKKEWLVGLTDGDGSFTIDRQKNGTKWGLVFKVSSKNPKVLNYVKKFLGYGSISKPADQNWYFIIRDRDNLGKIIFPIYEKYPLVTVKYYDYDLVKKAYIILEDKNLDKKTRNKLKEGIYYLLKKGPSEDYLSPVWDNPNYLLSKPWVTGFWEAEGSLYITKKGENQLSHGFGITQKVDAQILEQLSKIFRTSSKVKFNRYFSLDSTGHRSNLNLVNYFFDGQINLFIGIKSLQFTIWRRTLKFRGNHTKLERVRELLRKFIY